MKLLILEEYTLPTNLCVPQLQKNDWFNCFLNEDSVKIMDFDLNQLKKKKGTKSDDLYFLLNFQTLIQF